MAIRGNLGEVSLPDVLQLLAEGRSPDCQWPWASIAEEAARATRATTRAVRTSHRASAGDRDIALPATSKATLLASSAQAPAAAHSSLGKASPVAAGQTPGETVQMYRYENSKAMNIEAATSSSTTMAHHE